LKKFLFNKNFLHLCIIRSIYPKSCISNIL